MSYKRKLANPLWQKKRLEILTRDDFACLLCKDKETELHIHHNYYTKGKEPWEYDGDCYFTLCAHCHYEVEEMKKKTGGNVHTKYASIVKLEDSDGGRLMIIQSDENVTVSVYEDHRLAYRYEIPFELMKTVKLMMEIALIHDEG